MTPDYQPFLPLTPVTLQILIALTSEDMHGYAMMQEIARQSDGQYKISPGTLYASLQKLLDGGIVGESPTRPPGTDVRRRYYRLTPLGRSVLAAEVARLESVIRQAKLNLGQPRRTS